MNTKQPELYELYYRRDDEACSVWCIAVKGGTIDRRQLKRSYIDEGSSGQIDRLETQSESFQSGLWIPDRRKSFASVWY